MDRWSEQYYNAPLALSDFLREHRGVVYAIGLGTAPKEDRNITHPGPSKLQPDPYQNAFRDFTRHDYFLARLALDPYAAETNPGGSRDTSFRYIFDAGNGGFHQPPYRTLFRQDSRVNYMIPNFTPTPDFHNNDDIATNLSLLADFFPPPEKCTLASGSGGAATIGSNVPPKNRPRACRDMRYRYGEYLPTNNAADLNALFERIARKILLRLMR